MFIGLEVWAVVVVLTTVQVDGATSVALALALAGAMVAVLDACRSWRSLGRESR
ncbi:hypothetical protein [Solihabitans fulvus]|uniref:hypothetical protein n=1 Tax=Solihabitans fulvus TaxID=1892852 RepID=UPI00166194F2|nr:hypothetical protein [Solihabitans fulvus]